MVDRERFGTFARVAYWSATALLISELLLGGMWDVLQTSQVRETVGRIGFPAYVLLILGITAASWWLRPPSRTCGQAITNSAQA